MLSPFTLLWESYSTLYPAVVRIDWHAMSQAQFAIGILRVLLVVVICLGLVAWAVCNALLFVKRRTSFPKAWIGFNGLLLIMHLVKAIFDPQARQLAVGVAFWTIVGISYMLRSQRVRNTFVR